MDRNQKEALAMRVSVVTILGNLALTIFKLAAGVLAHSGAMISDAIHSGSDGDEHLCSHCRSQAIRSGIGSGTPLRT